MTRRNPSDIAEADPEIERTIRRNRRNRRRSLQQESPIVDQDMAQPPPERKTLAQHAMPTLAGTSSSIVPPEVPANFEIKPNIISMIQQSIQFDGLPDEDPTAHLSRFLQLCRTFKIRDVNDDAIRLRLFPFSLRGRAGQWLDALPQDSIDTWDKLVESFLSRYFPPGKTAKYRMEISCFTQIESESLYEAWDRFKELLRKCPHHSFPDWLQIQYFYTGLLPAMKMNVDAAAGGSLAHRKTPGEAFALLEEMALNNHQWGSSRGKERTPRAYAVDDVSSMQAKMEAMGRRLEQIELGRHQSVAQCDICGGGHDSQDCQIVAQEQVNFAGNRPVNNPYSNTYNPGWRNHPNFSWGGNNAQQQNRSNPNQGFNRQQPQQQQPMQQPQYATQERVKGLEDLITRFVQRTDARLDGQDLILKNQLTLMQSLETQIGQIARASSERSPGTLPGNTEPNPRNDQTHGS